MKTISKLSLVLILAGSLCPASAQVTLTRILEGDIATDKGSDLSKSRKLT